MSSEVPIFIQVDSGSDVEAMALGHVFSTSVELEPLFVSVSVR